MEEERHINAPAKDRQKWLYAAAGAGVAIILFAIVAGFIAMHKSGSQPEGLPAAITSGASIPLYFPHKPPAGFRLIDNSATLNQSDLVSFSLENTKGGKLQVIEQTKPPIMEEVTKTKEFTTSIGHAYLANLNGHTAGFIVGEKTLVILSEVVPVDDSQLIALMQSMKPAE
jgi:hypothetical protein